MTKSAKTPQKSASQVAIEKRQADDLALLDKKAKSGKDAMQRKRRGRASLISGGEQGVVKVLG